LFFKHFSQLNKKEIGQNIGQKRGVGMLKISIKKLLNFKNKALKYAQIIRYRIFTKHSRRYKNAIKKRFQRIRLKIRHSCKICCYRPFQWQAARAKTTFLLCIRPKNKRLPFLRSAEENTVIKNSPPPGYGVPPNYKALAKEHNYQTAEEYGLYLIPGRINFAIIILTIWLAIIIFTPFIDGWKDPTYFVMVSIYCFTAWLCYYFLFYKMMPVSLTQVWEKWPIPAYELFLSVPHKVIISPHDRWTKKQNDGKLLERYQVPKHYLFWRPDQKTPMWRQSTEHSANTHTLQDLILNLAIFEFLFRKNASHTIKVELSEGKKKEIKKILPSLITLKISKESLHEYHWYFFLFSPIVINLMLILLSIVLFSFLGGVATEDAANLFDNVKNVEKNGASFRLVTHFPYNFVLVVLSWFLFTIYYVHWVLSTLTDLSKKIHQGYFNAQLGLIPQQILDELSYIPKQEQIDQGINYVKKMLSWSSGIVFLGLMAMFEIFSQSASRLHINYDVWKELTSFFTFN
jgi:hypothetical protein